LGSVLRAVGFDDAVPGHSRNEDRGKASPVAVTTIGLAKWRVEVGDFILHEEARQEEVTHRINLQLESQIVRNPADWFLGARPLENTLTPLLAPALQARHLSARQRAKVETSGSWSDHVIGSAKGDECFGCTSDQARTRSKTGGFLEESSGG
jgi:hypothetical protein